MEELNQCKYLKKESIKDISILAFPKRKKHWKKRIKIYLLTRTWKLDIKKYRLDNLHWVVYHSVLFKELNQNGYDAPKK